LIVFFSSGVSVFAQKGRIEGKVTDAKTGQPLAGVSVIDQNSKKVTSPTKAA